jgi:Flp pilus assembly protein TadG
MLRYNQKGAALLEFAIILPILLLLVFGIIEFGLLFYSKQVITNASREGARAGIVSGVNEAAIKQIVVEYCKDSVNNISKIFSLKGKIAIVADQVEVTPQDDDISVGVTFKYPLLLSGIIGIEEVTVSAQTTMRNEPN